MAEGIGTCKKNNEEELLQTIQESLEESTSSLYKTPSENSKFYGLESHFNNDVIFYKDLTIHGKLNYNFTKSTSAIFENLAVVGTSTFFGFSDFYNGVYIDDNLNVAGIVTARQQLDVGCGGTTLTASSLTTRVGIATTNPQQTLDVKGTVTVSERIGIGSVNPQQKLDVAGSIKIDEFIYDSANSPGANGYYLSMDEEGIRWTPPTIPQNAQTSAYILAIGDVGKHISITTGGVTVNSSIFSAGDGISIYNNSGSNQTITQGASVTMYLAGTATTGNRTLARRGVCTVLCVASNTFVIFGAGLT